MINKDDLRTCRTGCWSIHLVVTKVGNGNVMVQCVACGSASDAKGTEDEAIANWNEKNGPE